MASSSLRVCTIAGCPELTARKSGRCGTHEAERRRTQDSLRPSTAERGYGSDHQRRREAWQLLVERGNVACSRCGRPILPGQEWDLDHTDDRTGYLGPSHAACNRATKALP